LLDRCADLKGQLVEFGHSRRFAREFRKALTMRFGQIVAAGEQEITNFIDHFVLRHRLADGRIVVEDFVAAIPAFRRMWGGSCSAGGRWTR